MIIAIDAAGPVPRPPDVWDLVERYVSGLLPYAAAWIASALIAGWMWYAWLRDAREQYRRATRLGRKARDYLERVPAARIAYATFATVIVVAFQAAWLFVTWWFVMAITWTLHIERQTDALQWNNWTATYLLLCGLLLAASYGIALGHPDGTDIVAGRVALLPLVVPALATVVYLLLFVLFGVIALFNLLIRAPGATGEAVAVSGLIVVAHLAYLCASWAAAAAPVLVGKVWQEPRRRASSPAP